MVMGAIIGQRDGGENQWRLRAQPWDVILPPESALKWPVHEIPHVRFMSPICISRFVRISTSACRYSPSNQKQLDNPKSVKNERDI